jgi:hypothetical protein
LGREASVRQRAIGRDTVRGSRGDALTALSMHCDDVPERVRAARVMQTRRLKDASLNTPKKVETMGQNHCEPIGLQGSLGGTTPHLRPIPTLRLTTVAWAQQMRPPLSDAFSKVGIDRFMRPQRFIASIR